LLDSFPSRTSDNVFIFYIRSGNNNIVDILSNAAPNIASQGFLEFLLTLGRMVRVQNQPKHSRAGWKISTNTELEKDSLMHPGQLNGDQFILFWSDVTSELAFIVPTLKQNCDSGFSNKKGSSFSGSVGASLTPSESDTISHGSMSSSCDQSDPIAPTRSRRGLKHQSLSETKSSEQKTIIIWLENFEDVYGLPLGDLLTETNIAGDQQPSIYIQDVIKDTFFIFIHPLQNGLFRIGLKGHSGRMSLATPLIDGMIVSRRSLGPLVRQTCLNMIKRKKLDCDSYHPPHVRRKIKIQEMCQKYGQSIEPSDFYIQLFHSIGCFV